MNLIALGLGDRYRETSTPRFTLLQKNHDDRAFFSQVPF
jgi:hypothetical protein